MNEAWLKYLMQLSVQYGSGDLVTDFMSLTLLTSFLALLVGLISYKRERAKERLLPDIERLHGMNGRIEKLDRTLNEFRTEMLRQAELSKGLTEFLKQEIVIVRDGIEELLQRKSGGTPPSSGGGGGSPGPGTREITGSELAEIRKLSVSENVAAEVSKAVSVELSPVVDALPLVHIPTASSLTVESVSTVESVPAQHTGLFARLKRSREGLVSKVKGFFSGKAAFEASMMEDLEELLITSDIGVKTTLEIIKNLNARLTRGERVSEDDLYKMLEQHLAAVLTDSRAEKTEIVPQRQEDGPFVVLLVGVNGAGKTTTVAKLAHQWRSEGLSVMVAAADTYRAAAVAQLKEWADRIQVPIISGADEAKPATVVYDAMVAAKRDKVDVLIIDTAGRLQNKSNLMQELEGIKNVMARHQAHTPHEALLVVDGSSGQNALSQAREFHAAVALTGVVITKLDGTPKGGIVVAIKSELNIPVRYIGIGEKREDLKVFNANEFARALVAREEQVVAVEPMGQVSLN